MCTVSWLIHDDGDGFELFANRDERRTRAPALPPAVLERRGVRFLAPTDADAGGTWIGVNDHGLVVCLLNGDPREDEAPPGGFTSRGLLVLDLLAERSLGAAQARLPTTDLAPYRGFRVLLMQRRAAPAVLAWDGRTLSAESAVAPLVSSTLSRTRATAAREAAWPVGVPTDHAMLAYHRSHLPEPGPWSVCMHREDARTVSFSHISVTAEAATFRYAPGPPCRTPVGEALLLSLPEG